MPIASTKRLERQSMCTTVHHLLMSSRSLTSAATHVSSREQRASDGAVSHQLGAGRAIFQQRRFSSPGGVAAFPAKPPLPPHLLVPRRRRSRFDYGTRRTSPATVITITKLCGHLRLQ